MLCHAPAKPYRWRLLSMCRAGFSSLLLLVPARLRSARSYIPLERLVGEIEAMLAGRLPPGYTWTARTQTCSPSSLPPPTLWSLASARRVPRSRPYSGRPGRTTGSEASLHREKSIESVGTPVWNTFREHRFSSYSPTRQPKTGFPVR